MRLVLKNFSYLLKFSKGFLWMFIVALFALTGISISLVSLSFNLKNLIDVNFIAPNSVFIIFFISSIALSFSVFIYFTLIGLFSNNLCQKIKTLAYFNVLKLPIKKFQQNDKTIWSTFLTHEIDSTIDLFCKKISLIFRNIFTSVICFGLLVVKDPYLSIVSGCAIFFALASVSIFGYKLSSIIKHEKNDKKVILNHIYEAMSSIKVIKVFAQEEYEKSSLQKMHQSLQQIIKQSALTRGAFVATLNFFMISSVIVIIYCGKFQIEQGIITAGGLMAFIFRAIAFAVSAGSAIEYYAELSKSGEFFIKLQDVLSAKEINIDCQSIQAENFERLCFKDVSFSYDNGIVLHNINFEIKAGEKIAIIGSSGSGKTTLINILLGLYHDYSGTITLNNKDINTINQSAYRLMFAFVPQDIELFSDTIYNNLTYGTSNISAFAAQEMLARLNLKEFTNLEEKIGQQSRKISGGQKQRIAIARALLKKPQILILDEATSELDKQNEENFYELILNNKNLTVILITHKFVHQVDKVFEVKNGVLTENFD